MPTLLRSTLTMFAASSLTLLAFYALNASAQSAWTPAPPNPPFGNVAGPLSTGAGSQTKTSGNISLGGAGNLLAGGLVAAPEFCLGADCITAWPSGGGTGLPKIASESTCAAGNVGDKALGIICGASNSGYQVGGYQPCTGTNTSEGMTYPPSNTLVTCTCTKGGVLGNFTAYSWRSFPTAGSSAGSGIECR